MIWGGKWLVTCRMIPTPLSCFLQAKSDSPDSHYKPPPIAATSITLDTGEMQAEAATKVFIVDDSFPIRERLLSIFADMDGVTVVGEAESPASAIRGILNTHPNSVVLDIHLRDGTGIEVLQGVGAIAPEIVFIVLTNYPNPQYRKAYLEAGASYFLDKTAEFNKVAEIISALGATRH